MIGYGATAVNPYVAFETLYDMIDQGLLTDITYDKAKYQYMKASQKGIIKVCSKMGISTLQSYCGAQIFEALGLSKALVDKYFSWTPTRVGFLQTGQTTMTFETSKGAAFSRIPPGATCAPPMRDESLIGRGR